MLNCGGDAGSCHGGNPLSVYEWIKANGHIAYASANPYLACSVESTAGWCEHVNTSCKPFNIARTCSGFDESGGSCSALTHYPNATVAEYGVVMGEQKIMAEVIERGPVACSVAATDAHLTSLTASASFRALCELSTSLGHISSQTCPSHGQFPRHRTDPPTCGPSNCPSPLA